MESKKGKKQESSPAEVKALYSEKGASVYNAEYTKARYFMPSVQFPKDKEEAIRGTAKNKGMSLNEFIRWCVLQHIDE